MTRSNRYSQVPRTNFLMLRPLQNGQQSIRLCSLASTDQCMISGPSTSGWNGNPCIEYHLERMKGVLPLSKIYNNGLLLMMAPFIFESRALRVSEKHDCPWRHIASIRMTRA